VEATGLRFGGTRVQAELLASAAAVHPPYAEQLRGEHANVLKLAEAAMTQTLSGNPGAAVRELIEQGQKTLSGKLIETAFLVMNRYRDQIADADALATSIQQLRERFNTQNVRPVLGERKRQAGGLTLRTGAKKPA